MTGTMADTRSGTATGHLIRGTIWMIAARWAMRLIGLVSTVILARVLAPDDFGVIAIALIVVGLLETVAYAGVDLALMRPGADSREHYDTAWTIQLIQGVAITAVLLIISPWVTPLFSEPRATAVVQVIALRSLISGLQNIGIVAFRKELDFAKDFRFTLYTKLLNFGIVVGSALALRNYWALVVAMTTSALIDVALSYLMHPYRPRLCMKRAGEIWGFSQWLILSRIGTFLNRKTDEFVVARVLGTGSMGGYHVANELATMPNSELVMPLRRALFPTLANLAKEPVELERLFILSFSTIAVLSLSVGFCLMAVAPELVPIVLGEKWISAIGPMRWLALYGAVSSLVLTLEVPLWVTGKTRLSAAQTWLELALLVPLAYMAARSYGVEGAALARLAVSVVVLPAMGLFVGRACSLRFASLCGALWRPLAAGLAMALAQEVVSRHVHESLPVLLMLKLATGALVFPASLGLLWLASGRPPGIEAKLLAISGWRRGRHRPVTSDAQ
jgi:O-antigen/teichoic acid export membrane protein